MQRGTKDVFLKAFLPPPVLVALYRLFDVGLLPLSLRCPAGSSPQYSPGPTACTPNARTSSGHFPSALLDFIGPLVQLNCIRLYTNQAEFYGVLQASEVDRAERVFQHGPAAAGGQCGSEWCELHGVWLPLLTGPRPCASYMGRSRPAWPSMSPTTPACAGQAAQAGAADNGATPALAPAQVRVGRDTAANAAAGAASVARVVLWWMNAGCCCRHALLPALPGTPMHSTVCL